jgi:hypothetical protein
MQNALTHTTVRSKAPPRERERVRVCVCVVNNMILGSYTRSRLKDMTACCECTLCVFSFEKWKQRLGSITLQALFNCAVHFFAQSLKRFASNEKKYYCGYSHSTGSCCCSMSSASQAWCTVTASCQRLGSATLTGVWCFAAMVDG